MIYGLTLLCFLVGAISWIVFLELERRQQKRRFDRFRRSTEQVRNMRLFVSPLGPFE
jgi:uncharacterized membrane protein